MEIRDSITVLKGIGEKTSRKFEAVGIRTIGDLVRYYPRGYDTFQSIADATQTADGQTAAVCGVIAKTLAVRRFGGISLVSGTIVTPTEKIPVVWYNMPYLRTSLQPGVKRVFRGRIKYKGNKPTIQQPRVYEPEEYEAKTRQLQPVYPLTEGLTENMLIKAIRQALDNLGPEPDYLPEELRLKYELAASSYALAKIHFPEDDQECRIARKRLAFDEFLLFLLALRSLRELREQISRTVQLKKGTWTDRILTALPYDLTGAQKRVWEQIERDMTSPYVMARLVQGDVGSGKTILAFLALVLTAQNGCQGALMAPTEVLARQHYEAFDKLMQQCQLPVSAVLITGSMSAAQRRDAYAKVADGRALVVIGTHAIFQEKVIYKNLSLVITDEQHRFGVRQRETLAEKGELPHTLVMSATPIPRTLAVMLYGDLDISAVDEMPQSRIPIKSCVVDTRWRPKAYAFIEKEVRSGHQAYVICPMVESSEMMDAEDVISYSQTLRENLPSDFVIEILHGRMKNDEKNRVMEAFARGEIHVLVSTTVVEVGVNVPNATVILIENAERFGLASLHQLRGRVGRGKDQAYCIFVSGSDRQETSGRLKILAETNDGFEIARRDLELRGPGDLFGVRQSGLIEFRVADIFADAGVMQLADEAASEILKEDPLLESEQYRLLKQRLKTCLDSDLTELSI